METSAAGIVHQLAICVIVLALDATALHVAHMVDVFLNGESSSRCVFAKREQGLSLREIAHRERRYASGVLQILRRATRSGGPQ